MISTSLAIFLLVVVLFLILRGYPIGYVLAGVSIIFFFLALGISEIDENLVSINAKRLSLAPSRIYSLMTNYSLLAIPYFILMGKVLEITGIAEELIVNLEKLFVKIRGGIGISVVIVGALLAASTSIVAASVITMGSIALPTMLEKGYSKEYSLGVIAASGTLGQIIPPSIVLIFLADQMNISTSDLFAGAAIPGIILFTLYIIYTIILGVIHPEYFPKETKEVSADINTLLKSVIPPISLIILVLGSILLGLATPTEAGALGSFGAILIGIFRNRIRKIQDVLPAGIETVMTVSSILMILIGSTIFALVFRSLGGDHIIETFFHSIPGDEIGFIVVLSLLIFILGFFLDFFEIIFIVIPLVLPVAQGMEINLIWLAILISLNIQTSFLTPPFGFSLFFLKEVVPSEIKMKSIYMGVIPFVLIQIICLVIVYFFPSIVLYNI